MFQVSLNLNVDHIAQSNSLENFDENVIILRFYSKYKTYNRRETKEKSEKNHVKFSEKIEFNTKYTKEKQKMSPKLFKDGHRSKTESCKYHFQEISKSDNANVLKSNEMGCSIYCLATCKPFCLSWVDLLLEIF